jgi:molybdopterin-guanine dinucleotide biosynthesis protein A
LTKAEIVGVILAGGRSIRMGRPKARLMVGGTTLIQRVHDRLVQVCPRVAVVTDRPGDYADLPCVVAADLVPDLGPPGGLLTAAVLWPKSRLLVVACDTPFLRPAVLARLVAEPAGRSQIVLAGEDDRPRPFPAVYPPGLASLIQGLLSVGNRRMAALWRQTSCRVVPAAEIARLDPDEESFINLNTPQEAARWLDD